MAHRARPQDPATDEALLAVMGATCSSLSPERAQRLLAFHRALLATGAEALVAVDSVGPSSALQQLMFCSEPGVLSAAKLLHTFPLMPLAEAVSRVYPLEAMYAVRDVGVRAKLEALLSGLAEDAAAGDAAYVVSQSVQMDSDPQHPSIRLEFTPSATAAASGGGGVPRLPSPLEEGSAMQEHHMKLLTEMLQSHAIGIRDQS